MRLPIPAALLALLFVSACSPGDQTDSASPDAIESERPAGDASATAGDETMDGTCESDRAQDIPSPGACASLALGAAEVEVQYGSPSVKGREVFGGLVPYDEVWRTGANEATTFQTNAPLTIGDETLLAGTYGLFTIPGETEWTLIFNSVADQWGAFEYDESQDVLRTVVAPSTGNAPQERFLISFERASDTEATMVLAWDDTRAEVPVSVSG